MKRLKIGIVVSLLFVVGCQTTPEKFELLYQMNDYPFYKTSIDNLPPAKDVYGIFIMEIIDSELTEILAIGDPVLIRKMIKGEYKAIGEYETKDILLELPDVQIIANHLLKAERSQEYMFSSDLYIALLTRRGAYMVAFDIMEDGHYIYGEDFLSVWVWNDFKTLGILPEQN